VSGGNGGTVRPGRGYREASGRFLAAPCGDGGAVRPRGVSRRFPWERGYREAAGRFAALPVGTEVP